jgi:hypothetical protein
MESYIVRIYRRDQCRSDGVVGLVESVDTGKLQLFHTLGELTSILAGTSKKTTETAKEKSDFELA